MSKPTRRQLVHRAVVAAVIVAAADALLGPERALAATETDAEVIYGLLATELLIIFAYQQVLQSRLLTQPAVRVAALLAAQERVHAAVLAAELGRLGVAVPQGPRSVAAASAALAAGHASGSLADLRTERDCLQVLSDLETLAERDYFEAIAKLRGAGLVQTAAQIMACEAQHWTALAELQYPGEIYRTVPYPYVTGGA
jgi:Ferritin-like domain